MKVISFLNPWLSASHIPAVLQGDLSTAGARAPSSSSPLPPSLRTRPCPWPPPRSGCPLKSTPRPGLGGTTVMRAGRTNTAWSLQGSGLALNWDCESTFFQTCRDHVSFLDLYSLRDNEKETQLKKSWAEKWSSFSLSLLNRAGEEWSRGVRVSLSQQSAEARRQRPVRKAACLCLSWRLRSVCCLPGFPALRWTPFGCWPVRSWNETEQWAEQLALDQSPVRGVLSAPGPGVQCGHCGVTIPPPGAENTFPVRPEMSIQTSALLLNFSSNTVSLCWPLIKSWLVHSSHKSPKPPDLLHHDCLPEAWASPCMGFRAMAATAHHYPLPASFILIWKVGKCWSWSSDTLATWCKELTHWKRPWCWERLRAGREGDDRGWDGWMASPTQWTWVWANYGR